jgi:hypothetical protein
VAEGCGQSDPVRTEECTGDEHHPARIDDHCGAGVEGRTWAHEHDAYLGSADGCSRPGASAAGVGVTYLDDM